MSRRMSGIVLVSLLAVWLAASYGLRYGLMEDARWLGWCAQDAGRWQCQLRANLGLLIHFGVFAWTAVGLATAGLLLPGRVGRALAMLALIPGTVALVLYTASLAVFALMFAGLRLVRVPKGVKPIAAPTDTTPPPSSR
jgi:hypothetical protein